MVTSNVDNVITAEVIRGALLVAAEEASIVVRAAHSTFIQKGADTSTIVVPPRARATIDSYATVVLTL